MVDLPSPPPHEGDAKRQRKWKEDIYRFLRTLVDAGIATITTNGIVVRTGTGAYTTRSLTAPAAGLTIANNDGIAGNPTFALANDLGAIEALGSGLPVRTGADTWAATTIAQGDLVYGSGANAIAALAKNTTATRVLTNTGTSNNPAWAQLDLITGATAAPTDWTPTISVPTGSIGAPTITYAKHVKIGRMVFISVRFLATITAGTPAYISITNLPYTSASLGAPQRAYGIVNTAGATEAGNLSITDNSVELQIYRAAFAAFTTSATNGTNAGFFYLAAS